MSEHAAIVGAGVIGAAWASRLVLHGIDVKVSDPNPEASRIVEKVLVQNSEAVEFGQALFAIRPD